MIDIDEYKEVLEALKSGFLDTADLEPYMQIICNALEKQIPKKPNNNYCPSCGQALDWSGEDE